MTSTPPKVSGSPEAETHRRWVEQQIRELRGDAASTQTRVQAISRQATVGGNVAAQVAAQVPEISDRTIATDSNNRIARPIGDSLFWQAVTTGSESVWSLPGVGKSTSRNVTWTEAGGFLFQPLADIEGAEIDITPILALPQSGKIYVEAEHTGQAALRPEIHITWRDASGIELADPAPTVVTGSALVSVPAATDGRYSVRLVRQADAGIGATLNPQVFEAIGTGGLNISPEGIAVEDENGENTVEINPTLPILDPPNAPILSSSVGAVVLHWNGSLSTGPTPGHLSYVYAEVGETETGPWLRVAQVLNRAGDLTTYAPVGETRWYRFTAMDTSNRPSAPSNASSIVVAGVELPDLDDIITDSIQQAIEDSANALDAAVYAQQTADGKNAIYVGPNQPTPAEGADDFAQGDLWYGTDAGVNGIIGVQIWNGVEWAPYRIAADSVFIPGSVGTISLADGVVTAPKVAAKAINAEHVQAGSISVNELTPNIGSALDININPAITEMQSDLEEQRRYYRFDSEGLKIGDPATNEELRLNPGRIEMVQAGNVPTWWEAQNFYVERMIVQAANIGSHRFEGYADGRTVIRPLRGV